MNLSSKIYKIFQFVRENGEYVERPYQTIGGMWTVDRWVHAGLNISVELMDEGSTQGIKGENLDVTDTYGQRQTFYKGTEADLDLLIVLIDK